MRILEETFWNWSIINRGEGVRLCCRKHKKKYYNRDNDCFNEGMGNGLEHIVNKSIDLGI